MLVNQHFVHSGTGQKKPFVTVNSMRIYKMYFHRNGNEQAEYGEQRDSEDLAGRPLDPIPEHEECVDPPPEIVNNELAVSSESEESIHIFGTLFLNLLPQKHVTQTTIEEVVSALGEAAAVQNTYVTNSCVLVENKMEDEIDRELKERFV